MAPTGTEKRFRRQRIEAEVLSLDGTDVAATAAELNRSAVSERLVAAAAATLAVTPAAHEGRVIVFDRAAGVTATLPDATGSGGVYRFVIGTTATSNNIIIKCGRAADEMQGLISGLSDDGTGGPVKGWEAAGDDDTITFNRTTTGTAKVGHWVELIDVAANVWAVRGQIAQSGTEATPFSETVT